MMTAKEYLGRDIEALQEDIAVLNTELVISLDTRHPWWLRQGREMIDPFCRALLSAQEIATRRGGAPNGLDRLLAAMRDELGAQ